MDFDQLSNSIADLKTERSYIQLAYYDADG